MAKRKPLDRRAHKYRGPWKIEVYRSGELVIRHERDLQKDGVLPVCSTYTQEDAETIQIGCCVLERYDNETYRLNPRYRGDKHLLELDDLDPLGDALLGYLAEAKRRRAERTSVGGRS